MPAWTNSASNSPSASARTAPPTRDGRHSSSRTGSRRTRRSYVRYRLEILSFIEQRFRQGIQISQQQIETYYHDTLLPQYAPGESIPPLDQVAPRIQEILLEQQVNVLFDNWLNNLRQQGDVEVLDPAALPPAPETPAAPSGPGRGGL